MDDRATTTVSNVGIGPLDQRRLERVIADASALERQADFAVEELMRLAQHSEQVADELLKTLRTEGALELFCGRLQSHRKSLPASQRSSAKLHLFWTCVRTALTNQFGGFRVPNQPVEYRLREATIHKARPLDSFWSLRAKPEGVARIWCLVAYARSMLTLSKQEGWSSKDVGELRKALGNYLRPAVVEPHLKCEGSALERWQGPFNENRLGDLRKYAAFRLLAKQYPETYSPDRREALGIPDTDGLLQRFQLLMTRGSEQAWPAEVSLLMRAIIGRYLNRLSLAPPWARDVFLAGISYVLERQGPSDGSWRVTVEPTASPVLHKYSPLLHILDLDTQLLGNLRERLVEACRRAISAASTELSARTLSLGDKVFQPEVRRLVDAIVVGLSLGAIARDRLKDLLSAAILDELGATQGSCDITLNDISNALGFRENLEKGVIEPWLRENPRRPGAILVYGPPGTGKTTVARVITSEINRRDEDAAGGDSTDRWRFLSISPAHFAGQGTGSVVGCAKDLFEQLGRVRRCVVLLDEMEEFLRSRGDETDRDSRLVTTAFLPLLQEAVDSREIILVVATNYVGRIDSAVVREGRFDLILPLGPPDREGRLRIIEETIEYFRIANYLPTARSGFLTKERFRALVLDYSMGYSRSELSSFLAALADAIDPEIGAQRPRVLAANGQLLSTLLWRLRSERVPTALVGDSGCDWRSFEDEARRYCRYATGVKTPEDGRDYWTEPPFPMLTP